jgi:hypothetical protein
MSLGQLSSFESKIIITKALPGQKPGSAADHQPRTTRGMADLRVEYITYLQGVSRPNQNELELEVSVSQMRFGKTPPSDKLSNI